MKKWVTVTLSYKQDIRGLGEGKCLGQITQLGLMSGLSQGEGCFLQVWQPHTQGKLLPLSWFLQMMWPESIYGQV